MSFSGDVLCITDDFMGQMQSAEFREQTDIRQFEMFRLLKLREKQSPDRLPLEFDEKPKRRLKRVTFPVSP